MHDALFPPYYKLGGLHALVPDSIPEWRSGLHVIATWTRDSLYQLDPIPIKYQGAFITTLARFTRLALEFDRPKALKYLERIPCASAVRPAPLLREQGKKYVVLDVLSLMQNTDETALDRGILFMKYVVVYFSGDRTVHM